MFGSLGELSVLSNWICSIYHLQLYGKPTPLQMLLLSVRRLFKIVGKSPVVESKVTGEILYLACVLVLVPQSSASRNFENFLFNQCCRGPPEQRGRGRGRLRGRKPSFPQKLSADVPFFAKSFKCALFERSNEKCN